MADTHSGPALMIIDFDDYSLQSLCVCVCVLVCVCLCLSMCVTPRGVVTDIVAAFPLVWTADSEESSVENPAVEVAYNYILQTLIQPAPCLSDQPLWYESRMHPPSWGFKVLLMVNDEEACCHAHFLSPMCWMSIDVCAL